MASVRCCAGSTPTFPVAFSISATLPYGPAALLHFILLSALRIRVRDRLGGGASSWRDLRELIVWPLTFHIEVLNQCLHLVFISERKLICSLASLLTQFLSTMSQILQSTCLVIRKAPLLILLSLPWTLTTRWHVLPRTWHQCGQFLPPWSLPFCLLPSGHCRP